MRSSSERDVEERVAAGDLEDLVGDLLDDRGARVVVLVDPVAEAHEALLAARPSLTSLMKAGTRSFVPISASMLQDLLVGAAVERAVEGGRRRRRPPSRDRRARSRSRASTAVRAVLLVVGVEDEEHVERACASAGFRPVLQPPVILKSMFRKLLGVGEVVVRVDVGHAHAVAVREGRERGHLRDQAVGLHSSARPASWMLRASG